MALTQVLPPLSSGLLVELTPGEVSLWRAAAHLRARLYESPATRADVLAAQAELAEDILKGARELGVDIVSIRHRGEVIETIRVTT